MAFSFILFDRVLNTPPQVPFYLWWIKPALKHCKLVKYCDQGWTNAGRINWQKELKKLWKTLILTIFLWSLLCVKFYHGQNLIIYNLLYRYFSLIYLISRMRRVWKANAYLYLYPLELVALSVLLFHNENQVHFKWYSKRSIGLFKTQQNIISKLASVKKSNGCINFTTNEAIDFTILFLNNIIKSINFSTSNKRLLFKCSCAAANTTF